MSETTVQESPVQTGDQPTLALVGVYDDEQMQEQPAQTTAEEPSEKMPETVASTFEEREAKAKIERAKGLYELEQRIGDQKDEVADAALVMTRTAVAAKNAKKQCEAAIEQLEALVDQRVMLEGSPLVVPDATLFDDVGNSSLLPVSEAWRSIQMSTVLGDLFTEKLKASFEKAQLLTLGEFADYTASSRRLTDLDGVGQATAEKIETAVADWWLGHPEMNPANQKPAKAVPEQSGGTGEAPVPTEDPKGDADILIERIDGLLGQEEYQFAEESLVGIRETVEKTGRATRRQCDAVDNIENSTVQAT